MSFISTKNLVAPLTNMVHLITILLIAICFSVLRLSGASLSLESSSSSNKLRQTRTSEQASSASTTVSKELPINFKKSVPPWEKEKKQIKVPSKSANKPGGLDDIEKSLGIR